uniref:Uncharacterized protein n=1 Tax=Glossina brevipalpis TaxID=37001 RepID=A0A1A9X2I2_9MUSC
MACRKRCKDRLIMKTQVKKLHSTELPGVSKPFWDDRFLHLPKNLSVSRRAQSECIKRNLRSVGSYLRARNVPGWYRALSTFQIKAINALNQSLNDDHDQMTTHRTEHCLGQLGLNPPVKSDELRIVLELSKANDLAFLWFLMERHYKKKEKCFQNEELGNSKRTYTINEQLIMSAISQLDMITTLRELEKWLPPSQTPNYVQRKRAEQKEQKVQLEDDKPKKPISKPKYILPYFSKTTCPVPKIPNLTAKPKDFKVYSPLFEKSKNPNYNVRNEETRWYADRNPDNIKEDIAKVYEGFKLANLSIETVEKLRKRHREIANLQTSLHCHLSKITEEQFNAFICNEKPGAAEDPRERIMLQLEKDVKACMEDFRKSADRSRKQFIQTTLANSRLDTFPLISLESYMRCAACETSGRDGFFNYNNCPCRQYNQAENFMQERHNDSFYLMVPGSDFADNISHSASRSTLTPDSRREDTSSLCTDRNNLNRKKVKKLSRHRNILPTSTHDATRCAVNANADDNDCPQFHETNTYSLVSGVSTYPIYDEYSIKKPDQVVTVEANCSHSPKKIKLPGLKASKLRKIANVCASESSLDRNNGNNGIMDTSNKLRKSTSQIIEFQRKYFPTDCVRESSETVFNYNGPARLHNFNYRRIFYLKDSEETLQIRRAFIDAIDSDVALLNELSDPHIIDRAVNECVYKMKSSASKAVEENEKSRHPLGFDQDFYDPNDEKLMLKMLKITLRHISLNPKFVGAALPQSYKLPLLREFIRSHFGKRYSVEELSNSLNIAKQIFYALEKLDFYVRRPSFKGVKFTELVDYSHRDRLVKLDKKMRKMFSRNIDTAMLTMARIYWFAMRPLLCIRGPPVKTFFAYLPGRLGDVQHFKVFNPADIRGKSILYR